MRTTETKGRFRSTYPRLFLACVLLLCSQASLLAGAPAALAQAVEPIASYAIDVTLNADKKTLDAHETITYVNITDEPIPHLVFHLYLNAFRDTDSIFLTEGGPTHRGNTWDPDHPGWIKVDQIQLSDGTGLELLPLEDGTIASAQLPTPVAPGESIIVELEFRAQLPRIFARTGYVEDYFMVGQWFPKLGVWEHGAWNAHPFHLNAEFYSDFGNYDVSITLPDRYVTGATGVPITTEIHDDGTQTVAYRAENVVDFAWTASPNFQLSTRDVDGTEVLYLNLPEHKWTVQRVLDAAQTAVSYYSRWYGPYPYPRLTIVDAPSDGQGAGGMEYPTLVTAGVMNLTGLANIPLVRNADRSLEAVIVHEIGHQWWQSMVGFNEAEEPWLDEGLTDYSTLRVLDALYGSDRSLIDSGNFRVGYLDLQRISYMTAPRVPMYGKAWDFGYEYSIATYSKPVLSWHTLERTIGDDALLEILNTFFRRYQYGHPTTEDLRAVAEETCRQDLSWFFDGLVYDDEVLNYAVTSINAHSVTVSRQGELSVPTEVRITFVDGSSALESWDGVGKTVTFDYPHSQPPIRWAEIDPERRIALDLRWSDNGRSRAPEIWAWLAIVSRILCVAQDTLMTVGGF